jgi:dephospho-CoA kinase
VRLALTGGIASGKSVFGELLVAFGASKVDFDLLAREALRPGNEPYRKALELLGPKAALPGGELDRPAIAKRIFKDKGLRLALEAIVHPYTWRRMLEELKTFPTSPLVVIDVPLLFEAGLNGRFDPVALCFASPETQMRRLLFRNPKLSRGLAKKMLAAQMPMSEKVRLADIVINNDGDLPEAIQQAKALYQRLTKPGEFSYSRGEIR